MSIIDTYRALTHKLLDGKLTPTELEAKVDQLNNEQLSFNWEGSDVHDR